MRNERVSMNFFDIGSYYLRTKMWKTNKFIGDWTPKIVGKYFTQITQNFVHFRRLAFCADVDIQAKKKFELTHICLIFESVPRILTENSYIVFKKLILNILMSCNKKFNLLFSLLWTKYQSIPGPRGAGNTQREWTSSVLPSGWISSSKTCSRKQTRKCLRFRKLLSTYSISLDRRVKLK